MVATSTVKYVSTRTACSCHERPADAERLADDSTMRVVR